MSPLLLRVGVFALFIPPIALGLMAGAFIIASNDFVRKL